MIDICQRIQDAVEYLAGQEDVDPQSGEIVMPVYAARYIAYEQAKMFPGRLLIVDPAVTSDATLQWFGCRVCLEDIPRTKIIVGFVKETKCRVFRRRDGSYSKIPMRSERICIDIPIPEEIQKWRA